MVLEHAWLTRRWLRFNLRVLLLLVTVIAVWLGWNLSIVRQREATIKYLVANKATVLTTDQYPLPPWRKMPISWRILGAKPVHTIFAKRENFYTEDDHERVQALFPEAGVIFRN